MHNKTSWLMSLNKGEEKGTSFGSLPEWAQQYIRDLRRYHKIQLETYGKITRKWGKYSMDAPLHPKDSYRLAGAPHCAAIRTGYSNNQAQYKYVFVTDPIPVTDGYIVSQVEGNACIGQLINY